MNNLKKKLSVNLFQLQTFKNPCKFISTAVKMLPVFIVKNYKNT